jgi:hypothetical protein
VSKQNSFHFWKINSAVCLYSVYESIYILVYLDVLSVVGVSHFHGVSVMFDFR